MYKITYLAIRMVMSSIVHQFYVSLMKCRSLDEDDFEWGELIDTGSCCNVFKAVHRRTGREVAMKKLFWTNKPSLIVKEAKRVASLRHPRIVELIGAYRKDDQAVLVFEYLTHQPFRTIVKLFDAEKTKVYLRGLFESLQFLHSNNVIHRDIKPANYLFDFDTNSGKLIDFGCSEDYIPENRSGTNRKAHRLGTKGFRAPEVLLGHKHQTTAIDMWSCGVILLTILTGRYPFFKVSNDIEELVQISRILGTDAINAVARRFNKSLDTYCYDISCRALPLQELCQRLNESLEGLKYPESVFDLLRKLLEPNPSKRITAEQALAHPFIAT